MFHLGSRLGSEAVRRNFEYLRFVIGSAKTQHNCARLNFQYKALNAISKIPAYLKIFFWFVEKEMSNNKNLDII